MSLQCLSLNCSLWPGNAAEARIAEIAALARGYDIVLLQEVFQLRMCTGWVTMLRESMQGWHVVESDLHDCRLFTPGLITMVRVKDAVDVISADCYPLHMGVMWRCMGFLKGMGVLVVRVMVHGQPLVVANVHLEPDLWAGRRAYAEGVRTTQIEQLCVILKAEAGGLHPWVLAGDLNLDGRGAEGDRCQELLNASQRSYPPMGTMDPAGAKEVASVAYPPHLRGCSLDHAYIGGDGVTIGQASTIESTLLSDHLPVQFVVSLKQSTC
jgi:endonuclease/exonuclease/phosphatase family metal-dependent hydrolase